MFSDSYVGKPLKPDSKQKFNWNVIKDFFGEMRKTCCWWINCSNSMVYGYIEYGCEFSGMFDCWNWQSTWMGTIYNILNFSRPYGKNFDIYSGWISIVPTFCLHPDFEYQNVVGGFDFVVAIHPHCPMNSQGKELVVVVVMLAMGEWEEVYMDCWLWFWMKTCLAHSARPHSFLAIVAVAVVCFGPKNNNKNKFIFIQTKFQLCLMRAFPICPTIPPFFASWS